MSFNKIRNVFLPLFLLLLLCLSSCSPTAQQELNADQYLRKAQILANDFQYREALQLYLHAWQISQTIDSPQRQTTILYNIGNLYYELQEYEQALKYYERSLGFPTDLENEHQIKLFNNLGVIYRYLGRYNDALEYFDRALIVIEQTNSTAPDAFGKESFLLLLNKSVALLKSEYPKKALNILDHLLLTENTQGYTYEIALTQSIRGILEATYFQNIPKALEHSQQALQVFEELDRKYDLSFSYHNIGRLYAEQQNYPEALRYYQQALQLCEEISDQETAWLSYFNLGNLYRAQADFSKAAQNYRESIQIIESIRSKLTVDDFKTSFLEDKSNVYKALINLLLDLGQPEEAFNYLERAKSRALVDLLSTQKIAAGTQIAESLLKEQEQLDDRIRNIREELRQKYSEAPEKRGETFRLTRALRQEQQNYQKLLYRLQAEHAEYASLRSVNPLTLPQIQRLIPDRSAFLEYVVLDNISFMFIVTRDGLQVEQLDLTQKSLEGQVLAFRIDIERESPEWQEKSGWLYAKLVAPAEKHLQGIDRLCIIPYGILHYLPFGTLLNNVSRQLLLEEFDLFYAPSSTVLQFAFDKGNKYPRVALDQYETQKGFLLFANPDGELAYAEEEAQRIQTLYPQSTLMLEAEVTEAKVKEMLAGYRVLHFATHGLLDPVRPLFSALILADGFLEVHEIFNELSLENNSLVTLSACNTALGQRSEGDEIIGLTRAFMYAGAPSIVASLWAVDDRSTALLMQQFYQHLGEGSKVKSLKEAQIRLFRDPEYQQFHHPYYWAAFELIGDYR